MKIRISQFIDFAYGDKRKDKAKARSIIDDFNLPYDPIKDRYKQFREAMTALEEQKITAKLNRPGFTGDRLVLLKRLYRVCSCLHRMPPQLRLV